MKASLLLLIGLMACHDAELATEPAAAPDLARGGLKPGSAITVTDLGLSGSGEDSHAEDIDDQGRIVGWRGPWLGPNRAFLWTPTSPRGTTGSAMDLGDLGGGAAQARGTNASGQIVGSSTVASGIQHPFFWEAGGMHDLGIPAGTDFGEAMDVNDGATRRVAGGVASPVDRAFVWTVSVTGAGFQVTAFDDLPRLSTSGAFAFALNDASVVVGYSNVLSGYPNQPVFWNNSGTVWGIHPLSLLASAIGGVARDVNSAGQIVGHNVVSTGCGSQAVVWATGSAAAAQLPFLSGGTCAEAWAVNDAGQISGFSTDRRGGFRAVLWRPLTGGGYSVTDLGQLGGTTPQVLGMNEPLATAGVEVVGFGHFTSGADHATLWTIK